MLPDYLSDSLVSPILVSIRVIEPLAPLGASPLRGIGQGEAWWRNLTSPILARVP